MSLAKAMDLIKHQKLYFACIQNMRSWDKYEGTVHSALVDQVDAIPGMDGLTAQLQERLGKETWLQLGAPTIGTLMQKVAEDKRTLHASCWHASDEESILMWNRYAPGGESIAIQTTAEALLEAPSGLEKVRIGVVSYNPSSMSKAYETACECFYKHPIFAGEREVRLVAYSDSPGDLGKGVSVPVDLLRLIKKVYVSPDAEDWFMNLVREILLEGGLSTEVHRTALKGS